MWRAGRLIACCAALFAGAGGAGATPPGAIIKAEYGAPTTRYAHAVLGDAVEWGALVLTVDRCRGCESSLVDEVVIRLPEARVFEDTKPRIFRDENGATMVMVVESHVRKGARLALYDAAGLRDATPYIGRAHRWLAPVGAADLDGDQRVEIAYVDRPHLAKRLRIWRLEAGRLHHVRDVEGLTNHKIGWDFIVGGIRECGKGPEMITADAGWTRIMATTLRTGRTRTRALGVYDGPESVDPVMACRR